MNEPMRIKKLFADLFDGDPWIENSLMKILSALTAEQAARKTKIVPNSIWETANHIVSWREVVLQRLNGNKIPTPEHNYFQSISDVSHANWKRTLSRLQTSQTRWLVFWSK